jgi:hypothetical protein
MDNLNIYIREIQKPFAEVFADPGMIFRGAPFWSWNNRLDIDQLLRQIDVFKEMGLGGFHMHPRTGLATEYLGPEYMAAIKACVEKAQREKMYAWLYDEDRWPSGFAGGYVTKEEKYRARYLLFTPFPYGHPHSNLQPFISEAKISRTESGKLLARYAVSLERGMLREYRRLQDGEEDVPPDAVIWYAYLEVSPTNSWFNNQAYVDTLNRKAIEKFTDVTHERYKKNVGQYFGSTITAIFTDEPQFTQKTTLDFAEQRTDIGIPWTDDLPETFRQAYGEDILDSLPEIFWELPGRQASPARYCYHDHVAERFASAFADTIGRWCGRNGIALTGHILEEPTLYSQTRAVGEAMRSYRSFQLPGIDMLCDWREYATAKQAQSAAHQYGRCGVLSELYGVTDWDYDFRGHKSQGDWQAALGVTVRVHHLAWVSMEGEAKRDYPASISFQSPWWKEYPIVEDHFARVNVALTRGRPVVRIGVIHPIESYWLCWGPREQTSLERREREYTFEKVTQWMLFGQLDFDFICESLLPELCPEQKGNRFVVGEMAYDAVVVPPMRTIRSTTLDRLEAFVSTGGKVIFAGEVPSLVDAAPSDRPQRLAERTRHISFTEAALLQELESEREVDVRKSNGELYDQALYQLRVDGDDQFIFICDTRRDGSPVSCRVRLRGNWAVSLLDTSTGKIQPIGSNHDEGWTELDWAFHPHGHLLLKLSPGPAAPPEPFTLKIITASELEARTLAFLADPIPVTLSEPNALLLDQAEWRLNGGTWHSREELLRLNNLARKQLGLPILRGYEAQPWTVTEPPRQYGTLELRFTIDCGITVSTPKLALEHPELTTIILDGQPLDATDDGWWVDEAIRTVPLPDLNVGKHELLLRIAYLSNTSLEWCYLLGDFGLELRGRHARIIGPVRELAWGDWTRQGLPFYTGNITYHCTFESPASRLAVRVAKYSGAMVGVSMNGAKCPAIAFAPYQAELGNVVKGRQSLDLILYGNRFNAFGAVHSSIRQIWAGPSSWRTLGDDWCYEYNLRPLGILTAPRIIQSETFKSP